MPYLFEYVAHIKRYRGSRVVYNIRFIIILDDSMIFVIM